jgi:hypothetical protein
MKGLTAWDLLKNNQRTNAQDWLHETPIISYGVITKVVDAQTVEVKEKVQISGVNTETYTVQLLTFSSMLLEIYAQPQVLDEVLLLFLRRHDPAMFDDPGELEERTGSTVVLNPDATGYTRFSGVGILTKTVKASAALTMSVAGSGDKAGAHVRSSIGFSAVFARAVSLLFDDPNADAEHIVKTLFGEQSPYNEEHWAKTHRQYGMRELPDGSLAEVDAAVNEEYSVYAPITLDIQGERTTGTGLGTDKDGKFVETEAPISEMVHGKAPITKDIRSSQTYTIGIGNDETGDASEQRDAPVDVEMGEKADITLASKSGLTAEFEKDIALTGGAGMTAEFEKDVKVTADDIDVTATKPVGINDGLYKSSLKPYLNAETNALTALTQAATQAAPQLAVLDGLSGGTGFVTALGAAIIAFCASMQAADTSAHTSIAKVVK